MGDKKREKLEEGIDETMSIDNNTHSFFGVSKAYADLIVQEYGKNIGINCTCFRGGDALQDKFLSGQNYMDFSLIL